MFTRRIITATMAASLVLGAAAAPALAEKPADKGGKSAVKGTTSVMFTKSVKKKLTKDGITVAAVTPAKKRNAVKYVFAATQVSPQQITHTGGLTFTRADKSLTLTDFVFDLESKTVDVTVPGLPAPLEDALDLSKLKITKKTVKANLKVAEGKSALLNTALGTELFTDGMFLAKANSKF